MDTQTLIDSYTNEVARRLPRGLRNEVGLELRALLADELKAASQAAGRAPDPDMTMDVLTRMGRPEEVAARYGEPRGFNVIEPEHGPSFVKVALFAVVVHWALTLVLSPELTFTEWWLSWGLGAFWWVGVLVVWYGLAAWIQRRTPVDPHSFYRPWTHYIFWVPVLRDWQPSVPDLDRFVYQNAKSLIPLSAAMTLLFASLAFLAPSGVDGSWAAYDADFRLWLLPPILALMVARLALFTFAVIRESARPRTEPIRFGLWVALVGMLLWALVGWQIFAHDLTNLVFKAWLAVFLLVNCVQIWAWIRRTTTRVRVPSNLASSRRE